MSENWPNQETCQKTDLTKTLSMVGPSLIPGQTLTLDGFGLFPIPKWTWLEYLVNSMQSKKRKKDTEELLLQLDYLCLTSVEEYRRTNSRSEGKEQNRWSWIRKDKQYQFKIMCLGV